MISWPLSPFIIYPSEIQKSIREEEADWLIRSAEAGNLTSMTALAIDYEGGMGGFVSRVGQDRKKAFEWRKKAAASGVPSAIACLSRLYRLGIGCDKNEEQADSLLEQAKKAAKGNEGMIALLERQSRWNPSESFSFPACVRARLNLSRTNLQM